MRGDMAEIRLPYTRSYSGRWYYVREGQRKIRLNPKGVEVGSAQFMERYRKAHAGALTAPIKPKSGPAYQVGTFAYLVEQYLASPEFDGLARRTRQARRRILLDLQSEHGARGAQMTTEAVRAGRAARAHTPAAADERVKVVSALYQWGVKAGLAQYNPAKGIGRFRPGGGFHCWTREQIAQYRAHWPLGTRERLALELLYGTAQRRGDVARMGPQHVRGPKIHVTQEKTARVLSLPLTRELAEAIRLTPPHDLTFLGFKNGDSFGNAFARWCGAAGLPKECRAHGLRKARATHLAEDGASTHEIAAVTGHKSLQEIERYTAAANQERLAERAFGEQSVPRVASRSTGSPSRSEKNSKETGD